jgi:cysteine dioxygenase
MTSRPIEKLCEEIEAELCRDEGGPRVAELLRRYAAANADWQRFALFDPSIYARNLVYASERYELLVICWNVGQKSPIHNHQGQRCWMAVLEGAVEETLFSMPEKRGAPLRPGLERTFASGQLAFITDDIALHEIRPSGGRRAVSMHLYSRPIRRCQIYDRESGEVVLRELCYYSVNGVPVAASPVSSGPS